MAEGLFRKLIEHEQPDETWRVESAGVWTHGGAPATRNAQVVMAERGIDLSHHRSQPISRRLMQDFDLILVMEAAHRDVLQRSFPSFADKVVLFRSLIGESRDFEDPVGGSLEQYRSSADEIELIISSGLNQI